LYNLSGTEEVIKVDAVDEDFTFLFTEGTNSNYLKHGWSNIEAAGTWSNRKTAILFLDFKEFFNYDITITMRPLPGLEGEQEVEIIFNGKSIDKFVLEDEIFMDYNTIIPKELIVEGENILEFRAKIVISPLQLGINQDSRNLAVYFNRLKIFK
jgi:hypothetical protein